MRATTTSVHRVGRLAVFLTAIAAALGSAGAAGRAAGQAAGPAAAWSVTEGAVRVRCPLTVGGSFDATTAAISGRLTRAASDAAALEGELAVDLAMLDTGIGLRNDHLRGTYLEVDRGPQFARAVLGGVRLERPLPQGAGSHRTAFTAELLLHGVRRPVTGEVELRTEDARMVVEARFPVRLPEFEIARPRYLGVGVRDEVDVRVTLTVAPSALEAP